MHDRVELLARCGVAEDAVGDPGAIERAARVEHVVAEGRRDLGKDRGTGRLQLVHDRVSVDDDGARLGEQPRHRALAGPDAAREADHACHGRTLSKRPRRGYRGCPGRRWNFAIVRARA